MEKFYYDNKIVRNFIYATIVWGIVGMLVGVIIAILLYYPNLLGGEISWLSFGRLRPLHTNAVIFAFVGNSIFAGIYYSMQRLLKTRMYSDLMSNINFWGWQFMIVLAAITLPMGITTSKEYAELEWPIDILIAVVWLVFGANMIMTMVKRRERHIYVAIWFYVATFITVTLLHVFNSLEIPAYFTKSYSVYAGVQDALVQWWYGHNAVAFFLTTPVLGLMYYFIPKAANRPVFSYRLSIVHFWGLIFLYIWAGPHHLLYTSLPDWAQNLGTAFSIMLIAPSWGGMINGLLTLRGAWDRVRDSSVLKFMVVAVTCYGMATFEGPMLALKNVNAIGHYTDWVPAHVHVGTLGWNGFMAFGMIYWLVPVLFNTKLYSEKLANTHFWIGTIGILLWVIPMYWAGFTQALLWKDFNPDGTLVHPNFLETVTQIVPMYIIRSIGGIFYLTGIIMLAFNVIKTVKMGKLTANEEAQAPALKEVKTIKGETFHSWLERKPIKFALLSLVAVAIGGLVQIVPMIIVKSNIPTISSVKPYTALELEGRDIYIREGCVGCHSQMIRPFRSEVARYGEYSKAGEFVYDHPFLWGSKRTGPDLHRIGAKYSDSWHYNHLLDPRSTSPGSIMPRYPWVITSELDISKIDKKLGVMQLLGVPYTDQYIADAPKDMEKQAKNIAESMMKDPNIKKYENGITSLAKRTGNKMVPLEKREIVALTAYLQRLGTDIKAKK